MASLEDFLRYGTTTQVNATRAQPQKPSVIRQRDVMNQLYEKSLATGTVAKPEEGGLKGLFADIIESPIGKAVLGAANVLDVPRRVAISGIKEIKDAFDGDPNTSMSWNELTQQIKDPSFGFGDVTGNLFGESGVGMFFNRVVGFAGDVLLDPLTYVTMGANKAITYGDDLARGVVRETGERVFQQSAKRVAKAKAGQKGLSIAGQEGRLALSRRLASLGADDAVVASAARYGRAGVKDAELLAKAGVDRAGLYWFGKRIAGTTRVGEALESGLSKSRVWFGDHLFSKPAKLFTAGDAEEARRALARGTTAPGAAKDFMLFVLSRNEERAAEAAARREAQVIRNEILGAVAKEDIDVSRKSAYKLLDYSNKANNATGATADERVASATRQFFDRLIGNVKSKMTELDPEAPIGEVDFYFPHFPSEDAMRWASNSSNVDAVKAREFMYNPLENTGAYRTRMQEGDEFFGTILTKDDIAGGIDRLNKIARDSGKIDFDFFETDLPTVLERYVDSYAKQQGRIARKKFLVDEDVYFRLEKQMGPDSDLIAKSSRVVNRRVKARDKSLGQANDIANKMLDEVDKAARGLAWFDNQVIEGGKEAVRSTFRGRIQMKNTIRRALNQLDEISGKMLAHQRAYNDLFNVVPWSLASLQREYDNVLDRVNAMRQAYATMEVPMEQLRSEVSDLQMMISDLRKTEARLRENAMTIQYHLDDIVEGRSVTGVTQETQNKIREAIYGKVRVAGGKEARVSGTKAQPLNDSLWNSLKQEVTSSTKGGPRGKMTKEKRRILIERYESAGGEWGNVETGAQGTRWWMKVNNRSKITASKVEEMATGENISNVVTRSLGGEAQLTELRTAAIALLSVSDHIPEKLADDLKRILEVADEADEFYHRLALSERDKNGRIVLEEVLDNWIGVQNKVTDAIRGFFQANRILTAGLGIENLDPNDVFPNDLLRRIVAEDNSPLSRLFEPFIGDDIVDIEQLAGMSSRLDLSEADFAERGFGIKTVGNQKEMVGNYMRPGMEPGDASRELTVGQFVDILNKYMDELGTTEFEVRVGGRQIGKPENVKTVKIRMSEIFDQKDLDGRRIVDMENIDDVEGFISTYVTGKGRPSTTQQAASLPERLSKVPAIRKLQDLVEQYPEAMQVGDWGKLLSEDTINYINRMVDSPYPPASIADDLSNLKIAVERKLDLSSELRRVAGAEETIDDSLRIVLRSVDEAIKATRAIQVPARPKGGGASIVTGQKELRQGISIADEIDKLREEISSLYSDVSVSDATYNWTRQASDNDVRAARLDVAAGRGGREGVRTAKRTQAEQLARKSVESVQEELSDALRSAWFFSEVETRFQRAADVLFKVGLAPDKDLYRRILNIVARDKGEMIARERMLYSRAHSTMAVLLEDIGSPKAWVGREEELYDTIIRAINPKGVAGEPAEWASILSRASGRADASRLRTKMRYYGTNSGAALKRRKLRMQMNSKSISAEERLALKAEYDAIPDANKLKVERRRLLENELRPWYKANVDSTVENPSWETIKTAVDNLAAVKAGGGRLAEDASARELYLWVKDSVERLETGWRNSIGKTGWMYDAADPYFVAKNFEETMIGGQDLPYMYASSLLRLADQYELAAKNFDAMQTKAAKASSELEQALPAERAALDKKRALEAGVGESAPSLKSISANEAERKALEAARKAQRQLVDIKNSDEWFAAVERNSLNDFIKLFATYSVAGDTGIQSRVPSWKRAQDLYHAKNPIYVRVASGQAEKYELVTNASNIVKGGVYYIKREGADVIGDQFDQITDSPNRIVRWSDAAGGEFTITREELDSLFMDPKEFASMRASKRAQYDNMIRSMDRQIIQLESNIAEMEKNIRTYMYGGDPKLAGELRSELRRLEDDLAILRDSRASMNFTSYDKEALIRNAALEKMSGLLQAVKSGTYSIEEIEYGLKRMAMDPTSSVNVVSESVSSQRLKYLNDIWETSADKKLIDKVRGLEFSEQAALFNAHMADTNSVLANVGKLREAASKAWRNTPQDGAPYGRGNFSISKYNSAIRAGKSREEALEAARVVRNISDGVVYDGDKVIASGRNVQEARAIVSGIDESIRKQLREITRTTNGQYDAELRFDQLIGNGVDPATAARRINDELRSLRPSDEALFRSASLEKNLAQIELAQNRIGFFKETMDAAKQWFWSPEGLGGQEMLALQMQVDNLAKILGEERVAHQIWVDEAAAKMVKEAEGMQRIPGYGGIMELEATVLDAAKMLKQSDTQVEDARIWYKWTKPMLERRVAKAEKILMEVDVRREAIATRPGGAAGSEASRAELMDWVDRMITTIESMNEDVDLLTALRGDFLNAQATLVTDEKLANLALRQLENLKDLKWGAVASDQLEEGIVNLARAGLPSYYASERIAEMSINMQRMRQPEFVRGLNRFIGRYTGYFKAGAVGTPGFVVRNTISNTFSLVSAGADPSNMTRGIGFFSQWKSAIKNNQELVWLNSLSDADREIVSTAIKAMDASGYGRAEEALAGWAPKRKWLTDNAYYRKIRKWNETSEQSARFLLAYDSAMKGASFDEATAIVKRYFFDYVDVSHADIAIRSVVPFWFWMSRNLPLQIVNQWTHPRAYQIYNSIKRNFGADEEDGAVVPSWLVERGAIGLGGRYFLTPDLPMTRIGQQVSELGDPKRLLNYVNPGVRVPFEVMFSSRRLYNDVPFSTDPQSPVGGPLSPAVQALAELLGQGKTNTFSGERGVSDKMNYAVMSLFPQLGQLERSIPSTDLYKDRQLNSLRSLLGIPLVNVTDDMIESELRRRRYEN